MKVKSQRKVLIAISCFLMALASSQLYYIIYYRCYLSESFLTNVLIVTVLATLANALLLGMLIKSIKGTRIYTLLLIVACVLLYGPLKIGRV